MNTYEQSGLTRKEFCEREGLSFWRFRQLRRRWFKETQLDDIPANTSSDFLAFESSPLGGWSYVIPTV